MNRNLIPFVHLHSAPHAMFQKNVAISDLPCSVSLTCSVRPTSKTALFMKFTTATTIQVYIKLIIKKAGFMFVQ